MPTAAGDSFRNTVTIAGTTTGLTPGDLAVKAVHAVQETAEKAAHRAKELATKADHKVHEMADKADAKLKKD